LADISWIPILERMDIARFWPCFEENGIGGFENLRNYWSEIQKRPAYRKGRAVGLDEKLDKIKAIIDDWKIEHTWFSKKLYNQ